MLNITIRVDGNKNIGLGHIVRSLALADELSNLVSSRILLISKDPSVCIKLSQGRYTAKGIISKCSKYEEIRVTRKLLSRTDILIVDLPCVSSSYIRALGDKHRMNVVITDDDDKFHDVTDVVIEPNLKTLFRRENRDGSTGCATNYVMLQRDFDIFARRRKKIKSHTTSILVCFGGSDPNNLTLRLAKALGDFAEKQGIQITFVVGASFGAAYKSQKNITAKRNHILINDTKDMPRLMWKADLAVVSGGTVMYEACAVGTPAIVVCQNQEQDIEARILHRARTVLSLGVHNKVSDSKILSTIESLVDDVSFRCLLSNNAKRIVESDGARRAANLIISSYRRRVHESRD